MRTIHTNNNKETFALLKVFYDRYQIEYLTCVRHVAAHLDTSDKTARAYIRGFEALGYVEFTYGYNYDTGLLCGSGFYLTPIGLRTYNSLAEMESVYEDPSNHGCGS